ncbi:DNA mismatch endonuclease (patch repair protein) [Mucilaginibacter sp. SG538B]|uniref:very short patch repair endonuclease n=1 Tax=Mucilaginibacter sp. SG538B TaxID=2587021 RepID=UPI00159E7B5D|nr:very short patch repair endonuclease [Mucilaginibacter sp. SG538B]NVM64782.1 DNA mismatch endonuclease (patch repair protein) [Mucilaginibacter sp. SG538B]
MDEKIFVPKFKKSLGFETTSNRSNLMKKIRSKENKAETKLRISLWNQGIRYRKNYKKLPGSPDIVINKSKVVVFVDGEFWHGYKWEEKKKKIKDNRGFWIPKIERNIQRDNENNLALTQLGYTVIRFWENQIKRDLEGCIAIVLDHVISSQS